MVCGADADTGGATAINNLGDASGDGTVDLVTYAQTWTSQRTAAGAILELAITTADLTNDVSFIDMAYTDDGDANGFFMRGYDNATDLKWSIGADGAFVTGAITATGAIIPGAADTYALGSADAEFSNLFLGDGAIIYGQNDSSNTITSSATDWSFAKDIVVVGADITLISATAGAGITGGDGTLSLKGLGSGTDEIMTIDLNSANLITIASTTDATFAFTPAVGFTAATTHGAGIVISDAQTLTFDEAASEPDDADVRLSGADGVLTIAAVNGGKQ